PAALRPMTRTTACVAGFRHVPRLPLCARAGRGNGPAVLPTSTLPPGATMDTVHVPAARRVRIAAALLTTTLALLAALPAHAATWAARHGMTAAQYQQAFNDFGKKGYRLASIAGYDSGGARYAALWKKASGLAWAARHGLDPAQYQATVSQYVKQGYRLTWVNVYAVGGKPYYA